MSRFLKVAQASHISEQTPLCVEVEGRRIALFRLGETICAIDDVCTHEGGPLSEGFIDADEVECPWHGARFNIQTGAACCPPADDGVAVYKVRVSGDDVELEL